MKILISGHTSGIGLAINEYFTSKNCMVTGYSRSTGYDLREPKIRQTFILTACLSDVVILNANIGYHNIELFYNLCNMFKSNPNKTIVVIGSHSTETTKNFIHPYQIEKLALEEAARQVQNVPNNPTVLIVRPGYVDTPSVSHVTGQNKMQPMSVAKLIYDILDSNRVNDYKILNILLVPK